MAEMAVLDAIRRQFELYGFAPIETRSVEPLDQLLSKGETDKEIYLLRRLQARPGDADTGMGLHFDLTVPFARYVLQNRASLRFPFKRYQIQKAWRGERPQEGRYREFYQADIDIIDERQLPLHFDAEMPRVLHEVLAGLPIPPVRILINNRKVLEGFYRGIEVSEVATVLRIVDKLDKAGEAAIRDMLKREAALTDTQADFCIALAAIRECDRSFADKIGQLGVKNDMLQHGIEELLYVMESLSDLPRGSVEVDLHIARGFDYYTGTVYEGIMVGHESLGAVCSGGRYDELATLGTSTKFPGVGVSIGVSRILGRLFGQGLLKASRKTPTCVLVTVASESEREDSNRVARILRRRDICCEVAPKAAKYGQQIRYAADKGVPYVWFPRTGTSTEHEVLDLCSRKQTVADIQSWMPDAKEMQPQISYGSLPVSEK